MTKLAAAVSVVMLFATTAIADVAPLPAGKTAPEAQGLVEHASIMLMAGTVVLGGVMLVAGNNN